MEIPALRHALGRLAVRADLTRDEAREAVREIMAGSAPPSQVGALLLGLRVKGETVEELTAFAEVLRENVTRVRGPEGKALLDTAGTGGDGRRTFNVSTAAAIVAAGAGATVAKHGNRAVSSGSGSADVLRVLGVDVDAPVAAVERCLAEAGIAFLFAPLLHPATGKVAAIRRELGVRTIFNLLGPLTNPAGARRQVAGVFAPEWVRPMADVFRALGTERTLVVHGAGGVDEVSLEGETRVAEATPAGVREYAVAPEDFSVARAPLASLAVDTAEKSAETIRGVLAGTRGPARDAVLANAALALVAAGIASDPRDGARRAAESLDSGAARRVLDRWAAASCAR
ncbi:MAG: anthranilate phosphoribosyltransferase [Planctomycetales bacterium]|nr:anthranilate phosphoribosyltransferase [Planctomycetales bacterium]